MVKSLEAVTASANFTINCRKTKTLSLTRNGNLLVGGEHIEAVDKFTYLGSEIDASRSTDLAIENRIKKARSDFRILSPVWRNANLSTGLKRRLFKSNVVSVLLYGLCTWKVTSIVTTHLQIFVNWCLRKIIRIYWPNIYIHTYLARHPYIELGLAIVFSKLWSV